MVGACVLFVCLGFVGWGLFVCLVLSGWIWFCLGVFLCICDLCFVFGRFSVYCFDVGFG